VGAAAVRRQKRISIVEFAFDEQTRNFRPTDAGSPYSSDETSNYEIYVQSFSADGKLGADKKIISSNGGNFPSGGAGNSFHRRRRSDDGFVSEDRRDEFEFATPKPLFKTRMLSLEGLLYHEYDVSPDGQRFLIGTLIGETKAAPPTVFLNWTAALKK
jgi:hypothetical protein